MTAPNRRCRGAPASSIGKPSGARADNARLEHQIAKVFDHYAHGDDPPVLAVGALPSDGNDGPMAVCGNLPPRLRIAAQ